MGIDEVGTITVEIFEKNAEQKINYESLKKSCSEASRNQSNFKAGNVRKLSHIIGDQVEFQKVALKTAFMVAPYRRPKRSMSTPLRNAPIPPWLLKAHSDLFDNSGIPMSPFEQRLRYYKSMSENEQNVVKTVYFYRLLEDRELASLVRKKYPDLVDIMETDLPLFFVMLTPQVMNEIEAIEIILETKASDSHEMTQIHETVDGKEKEPQDLAERTDSAEASITHRLELMREALEFDSCEAYHFDIIIRGQRLIGLIDSIGAHSQISQAAYKAILGPDKVENFVTISWKIGDEDFEATFKIFKSSQPVIVFGVDFLTTYQALVEFKERTIVIKGEPLTLHSPKTDSR